MATTGSVLKRLQDQLRMAILKAARAESEEEKRKWLRKAREINDLLRKRGLDRAAEHVLWELEKSKIVKREKDGGFELKGSGLEHVYDLKRREAVSLINRAIAALEGARDMLFGDAAQFSYPRKEWRLKVAEAYRYLKQLGRVMAGG